MSRLAVHEILLILAIALLFVGTSRLADIKLAEGIRNLMKSLRDEP
jgi:Sec-independent protein translocase protein TatA